MKWSAAGIVRRFRGSLKQATPRVRRAVPAAGLEPLETRVLLSAVGLGELPEQSHRVEMGLWGTYQIDLPGVTKPSTPSTVSGVVFRDLDADGWQDPNEHTLKRVRVFADIDGDGQRGTGEASTVTDRLGKFYLSGLPTGTYDVRVVMPDDYKSAGTESATVPVSPSRGVSGLRLGIVPTGFDLGVQLSDVSMPDKFKTGTRVKVPVLVTNRGDTFMPAGDINLRVFVSEDLSRSDDDIRLATFALNRGIKPGASVKVEIEVDLPNALAAFTSHLIVDAVGKGLRSDLDRGNNTVVSQRGMTFTASSESSFVSLEDLDIVLGSWNPTTPYGGYEPGYGYGDGFVGIEDLNQVLGNWNAGSPPTPQVHYPSISSLIIEGGYMVSGGQNRITAEGVVARYDRSIDRVMFFYDADGDRTIDDVLGVDTDGSDGYSIVTGLSSSLLQSEYGTVVAIAMDDQGNLGGMSESTSARLGVTVSAGKKLVYREADGTVVEVSLAGRGDAQVELIGSRIRAWDLGDTVEITGAAEIGDILFKRTNGRSKLYIKANQVDNYELGTAVTGKITGSTPLGLLSANGVDLTGGIEMTGRGVIRTIKAASINRIHMPRESYAHGVNIVAGKVTGAVTIGSTLRLLDVGNLAGVNLTTPNAERILVKRDFKKSQLNLTDNAADLSLGLLQVGRRMQDVTVHASSSVDTIRANSMVKSQVLIGGSSWVSAPASLATVEIKKGKINNLTVSGGVFAESYVAAWRIGQVRVDKVGQDTSGELNGLYYRRLGRYNGPDSLGRTVV